MESIFLTSVEQLIKPQLEPVTIPDVREWVGGTTAEDHKLGFLIAACRSMLEKKLGIAFYTQELRATYEFATQVESLEEEVFTRERMTLTLPRPPLQDLLTVEVESDIDIFTLVDEEMYELVRQFPAQIYLYGGLYSVVDEPWWLYANRDPRIRCTYTCGYKTIDDIPDELKLFLMQVIADTYLQREGGALSPELGSMLAGQRVLVL